MAEYSNDLDDQAELDTEEIEPVEFWASKQKELVTSVVDYNLSTIVDLIREETIDLDPTFQRRLRWDGARQSKLIESFLMNVPVPQVFLNEDEYGKYSVIDGKQRLNTIDMFLKNELVLEKLQVFSDINGLKFNDLPSRLRSIIRTRPTVRATIILRQSDSDIKYEVFQRLNTGGARLNPQEIRNNAFHGSLNRLIMRLSDSRNFHAALNVKNKYKSAIFQEMRDAELVLRYFTFRQSWSNFSGGIKRAMDSFMDKHRNAPPSFLTELEQGFQDTLAKAVVIFGPHPFQRWMPERSDWRKHALAALFDAQMLSVQEFHIGDLQKHKEQIVGEFKQLFVDQGFRKSIDAATNTPSLFKMRIERMRKLISNIL